MWCLPKAFGVEAWSFSGAWNLVLGVFSCLCFQTHTPCFLPAPLNSGRQPVATKEHRRQAKGLIEKLEGRVHAGPPVALDELDSAREFLRRSEFSPASDYFQRLSQIQWRLERRDSSADVSDKRNYGGQVGGQWLQLQSAYDHVIVSTCYGGQHNGQRGRIKLSHRFNEAGRIDFVELKFLQSLQPHLNGALRKLISMCDYQHLNKDWSSAEAFVLPLLPRELIFLYADIFRCDRAEVLAWLINIGHTLANDLLGSLVVAQRATFASVDHGVGNQRELSDIGSDPIAVPILEQAATIKTTVDQMDEKRVIVRYCQRDRGTG